MTENKKTAGYFDSIRNCPIYEGDVYWGEGEMMPFHKVVKTTDGFRVHHVGTTETFALGAEGQNLIKKQYIGNLNDNPEIINEFLSANDGAVKEPEQKIHSLNGESEVDISKMKTTTEDDFEATEEKFVKHQNP